MSAQVARAIPLINLGAPCATCAIPHGASCPPSIHRPNYSWLPSRSAVLFTISFGVARGFQGRARGGKSCQTTVFAETAEIAQAKRVLIPISDGSDAIEAVTVVDVLRRAGAEVVVASMEDERLACCCASGINITADVLLREIAGRGAPSWDLIAIPGGERGADTIRNSIKLHGVLQTHFEAGRLMGAIGVSPESVLEPKGFLEGFAATAHPSVADGLGGSLEEKDTYARGRVIVDSHIITSQGPGTALEWSLCLVEKLYGIEKAKLVAAPLIIQPVKSRDLVQLEWRREWRSGKS